MAAANIVEQLIAEIQSNKVDLNGLQYGEVTMIIQDGHAVRLDYRKSIKITTESKYPGLGIPTKVIRKDG